LGSVSVEILSATKNAAIKGRKVAIHMIARRWSNLLAVADAVFE